MATEKKSKNQFQGLWAILCKSASIDQQSNQLSIFNIVENTTISKSPTPITPLSKLTEFTQKTQVKLEHNLVVQFERLFSESDEEFTTDIELKVTDPDNEVTIKNELPFTFEKGKNRMRIIITLDSLVVTKSGKYTYFISAKDSTGIFQKKLETSVDVKIYE